VVRGSNLFWEFESGIFLLQNDFYESPARSFEMMAHHITVHHGMKFRIRIRIRVRTPSIFSFDFSLETCNLHVDDVRTYFSRFSPRVREESNMDDEEQIWQSDRPVHSASPPMDDAPKGGNTTGRKDRRIVLQCRMRARARRQRTVGRPLLLRRAPSRAVGRRMWGGKAHLCMAQVPMHRTRADLTASDVRQIRGEPRR